MNRNASSPDRLLLRVQEAAEMCGVSRSHFYGLLQRGEVPSVHLGRSCRIPRLWIESYIAGEVAKWQAAVGGTNDRC